MTRVSRFAAVALLACAAAAGARAEAQEQLPPPAAAQPAPEQQPWERRHRLGVQVGGTGFLQMVYRYRVAGPVHLDTGLFGAPHGSNMSAGLVAMFPAGTRWLPYVGLGGGLAGEGGPKQDDSCDPAMTDCPLGKGSTVLRFVYARAGIGLAVDDARRNMLALDVGVWWGTIVGHDTTAAGVETKTSRRILWPMAGFAYLHTF
jgi:hypothetical protein